MPSGSEPSSWLADHFAGAAGVALGAGFADAKDRQQTRRVRAASTFARTVCVGLAVILPPLGMADDHRPRTGIPQHFGGNFAGISAGG